MTEKYLKDVKWLLKNSLCMIWAILPVFGWFGLMFMGKKSGRRQLTVIGTAYGIVSILSVFMTVTSSMLQYLAYNLNGQVNALTRLAGSMQEIGVIAFAVIWPVCLIHTAICSKQYFQYLALRRVSGKQRHPLTADWKWSLSQLGWMLWCFFPYTGGLGLYFAGRQLDSRKLKRWGIISVASTLGFHLITQDASEHSYFWSRYVWELDYLFTFLIAMLTLLTAFLIREDFLGARAKQWEEDTRQLPMLGDGRWRRRNSRWQIWTVFPYLGCLGIIQAGNRSRNRALSRTGMCFAIASAAVMLFPFLMDTRAGGLAYGLPFRLHSTVSLISDWSLMILWLGVLYYGTLIRGQVLKARARSLQGYEDEFHRDLDLQSRVLGMETQVASQLETLSENKAESDPEYERHTRLDIPETPKPEIPQVHTSGTEGLIDINRCTQAELMQLPGIGIVQAKEAMAYRQEKGDFRSLDEFVQVLGIKPHFAVQIFDKATVEARPTTQRASGRTGRGRRLDF